MALTIVTGSDNAGYGHKSALKELLEQDPRVEKVIDVGVTGREDGTYYPNVAVEAAEKIAVSSPGTVAAVAIISSLSYMIPMVLYSGNTTRSMPGRPSFMPLIISAILRALSRTSALVCRRGIL